MGSSLPSTQTHWGCRAASPPPLAAHAECFWFLPTGAGLQGRSRHSLVSWPRGKGARGERVQVTGVGCWVVALSGSAFGTSYT